MIPVCISLVNPDVGFAQKDSYANCPAMTQPQTGYWEFFAAEARRGKSPLYEKLALGIGADPALIALAMRKKDSQPAANILLGAVHLLLLQGADHPLADHYPSVRPDAEPNGDPVALFADFVRAHEAALIPLIETGVTNTNEVGRSATLLPAFDHIARATGQGLHLIELGPSAGFNLNFDRYGMRFLRDGAELMTVGPSNSAVLLACDLRGSSIPPLSDIAVPVLSRRGLELNPIDLRDPRSRLWLKALVWPELTERHRRLDQAIASQLEHPVAIFRGDAMKLLGPCVETLPSGGAAVVFHSHVTYQFTPEMRAALDGLLVTLSALRPIHRISIEFHEGGYPIRHGLYSGGTVTHATLGRCDPHGMWMEWGSP
jgi:hypothetical protein